MDLIRIAETLREAVEPLRFPPPVTHVYNPLAYAWTAHTRYLERYGGAPKSALLLGMNPGPWGMVQTGVPFGDMPMVRDWLRIEAPVDAPLRPHPKRPVQGFACSRREVSGRRLWGWAQDRFGTPEAFFDRFFVYNYCPLAFMEDSGRNFTPDKLPVAAREALFLPCNEALRMTIEYLRPRFLIGVGAFAEARLRQVMPAFDGVIGAIPHPSPASPVANRGWAEAAETALKKLGAL